MKKIIFTAATVLSLFACKNEKTEAKPGTMIPAEDGVVNMNEDKTDSKDKETIHIEPISHATAVVNWDKAVFYTDPVGGAEAFENVDNPDFILVTDIHGDHMNAATLEGLELGDKKIIVPQAVKDELPTSLQQNLMVMNNGDSMEIDGFTIEAIPMYNLPEADDAMHVKGRGNGYIIEKNGKRLYISGDTEDIPEMRNLKNIDAALVCMNLPYTMPVDQAADGVLAFAPKKVYPYHYRGKDGLADVEKFKSLVEEKNNDIEVILLDWYPEM
ncbi:MBL fold metallo-hydrolase [Zunongwangia sp. HRR-M8]|uniref:MBL fold metallo-hydrolase n=1 Tax=Zunongwangia sp. HRR-M8 TaxID=3015170 RepID=UPI0022DD7CEA|nr:MBL fold metallo-hydrolase [Zunongwangia sp. HRR-M8]WBL23464.1 MBL fold metallo-hydrolase [Zunongwangia sp. HRR-M8]